MPRCCWGKQETTIFFKMLEDSDDYHDQYTQQYKKSTSVLSDIRIMQLNGSVKEPNISIYFFFPPISQWCSISDVLFTGGRGVSDFSVLKYY